MSSPLTLTCSLSLGMDHPEQPCSGIVYICCDGIKACGVHSGKCSNRAHNCNMDPNGQCSGCNEAEECYESDD
jgi:hypothetical protein